MPYLFMSHSSKDRVFTLDLAGQLEAIGFETWVDIEDIPDGSTWAREIQKAIEGCAAIVVVWSKSAAESEWVEREALMALHLKKPAFVALIDDTMLPIYLINVQFSDFRRNPMQGTNRLAAALRKRLAAGGASRREEDKVSPDPNEHNFFKYLEQVPDGRMVTGVARDLFKWARRHADSVMFTGRSEPAFHAYVQYGDEPVRVFSVRAYSRQPAVEVPLQYLAAYPPYDRRAQRLHVLNLLNRLVPDDPFPPERADFRPNVPLVPALAEAEALDMFKAQMADMLNELRHQGGASNNKDRG